jgi:outer membrane receptor for ferrienterochelin and colicins
MNKHMALINTLIFKKVAFFSALYLASLTVFAKESPDYFNMSLQELLQIKVSVASLNPERIIDTPAVVSRYNMQDMSGMGLRTLKDLLSFIPGFVLQDSRTGGTTVMIRGLVEGFNQKVLFLLDGVPYWMPSHSEIPLLGMPLESISHVEVIRGPGAVIYGSNASAGVINIVTKQTQQSVLAVSLGSNQKRNGGGYIYHDISDDSSFSLAFEVQSEDGYEGEYTDVSQPGFYPQGISNDGADTKSEEMKSLLAKYNTGEFNVFAQTFKAVINAGGEPSTLITGQDLEHTGYLLHADNTWNINSNNIRVFSDYNRFSLTFEGNSLLGVGVHGGFRFADNGRENYRWRSGGSILHRVSDELNIFAGIEFERRNIEDYFIYSQATNNNVAKLISSQHTQENSLFTQADYTISQWRFVVGGRYTDNSQSGEKFTPRLSSVYKIDQSQSLKLLYSVGFNSPNFAQTYINAPGVLAGNAELTAETVKTLDLAYSYEENNNLFVGNVYYLKGDDFIQRKLQDGVINFFNTSEFERVGIELDYQRATPKYLFFANLSYIHQGNTTQKDDVIAPFTPKITGALGISYDLVQHQSVGLSLRVVGEHNNAPASYPLNVDYGYEKNAMAFFFTIRNIFNEDLVAADIVDLSDDQLVPNGDGINILTGLKYSF